MAHHLFFVAHLKGEYIRILLIFILRQYNFTTTSPLIHTTTFLYISDYRIKVLGEKTKNGKANPFCYKAMRD